jgi:hypothetical protein
MCCFVELTAELLMLTEVMSHKLVDVQVSEVKNMVLATV